MKRLFNKATQARGSFPWVYSLIPLLLVPLVTIPLLRPVWENDFFLHLQLGKDILANHRLTGNPNWLYGPNRSGWVTTMAVPEVLMYLIYHYFGFIAFTILEVLAGLLLIPIFFLSIKFLAPKSLTLGAIRVGILIGAFAILIYSSYILPRPQTVSLLFFPIICLWLINMAVEGRAPKTIPATILIIVWTWFHGYSLLVAPLLLISAFVYIFGNYLMKTDSLDNGAKLAFQKILSNWKIYLILAIAPIFNPIGYKYWISSLNIRQASSKLISEWAFPTLDNKAILMVLSAITLWFAASLLQIFSLKANKNPSIIIRKIILSIVQEGLLLLGSLVTLAQTQRTAVLLIPLFYLILARRSMRAFDSNKEFRLKGFNNNRNKYIILSLTGLMVISLIVNNILGNPNLGKISQEQVPLKIFSAMKGTPGEHRIIISYNISSTLIPYVPNAKVSIDGRTDKFGKSGALNYVRCIGRGMGCDKILKLYPGSTDAVLSNKDKVLKILEDKGWTVKMKVKTGKLYYIWLQAPKE